MKKMVVVMCTIVLALGVAGCTGKGKAPIGKGKAPVVQTKG
jgi:outer membrane lipoprotein-sorting protein